MAAEIITRALLEYYLRATDWTRRDRPHASPLWERGNDSVPDTWLEGEMQDAAVGVLTIAEKRSRQAIGTCLGLCAAAEYHFEEARLCRAGEAELRRLGSKAADRAEDHALSEERHARRLLEMAGVDPKRWEEAREAPGGSRLAPCGHPSSAVPGGCTHPGCDGGRHG